MDDAKTETPEVDHNAQAALVEQYLEGTPPVNIGALCIPPIWGPAKGIWATILWYPLWVFADNCLFAWWSVGTPMTVIFGVLTLVLLIAVTIAFAVLSRPVAALRAVEKGKTKKEFVAGERRWAIAGVIIGIGLIAFATYFNLVLRAPIAG